MKKVDLNVDIGEGFPNDEALLEFATSANVCCGEHAGSWELTVETVAVCVSKRKRVGMHPGFPDRKSMGRHLPNEVPQEWIESLRNQMMHFHQEFEVAYVKPHGAWYQALTDLNVIKNGLSPGSIGSCGGVLFGMLIGSHLSAMLLPTSSAYKSLHLSHQAISEGFADRAYRRNGTLVPRSERGAVYEDPKRIRRQVLALAPRVDSICLHGDTPNCLEFAELVYKTLVDAGYEVGY